MNTYSCPNWFQGYDVVFEIIFALITLIVFIYAYKLYRKSEQKHIKLLSISFFLIALSNIVRSIINFFIYLELNEQMCSMNDIKEVLYLNTLGIYVYMLLMITGLILLVYMSSKKENSKMLIVTEIVTFIAILTSANSILTYQLISILLLTIISAYFIKNYLAHKNSKTFLIALAFLFLLIGSILLLFHNPSNGLYAIVHIFDFIGYLLIIMNLYLVQKR